MREATIEARIGQIQVDVKGVQTDVSWVKNWAENFDQKIVDIKKEVKLNSNFRIESVMKNKLVRGALGSGWILTFAGLAFMIWSYFN